MSNDNVPPHPDPLPRWGEGTNQGEMGAAPTWDCFVPSSRGGSDDNDDDGNYHSSFMRLSENGGWKLNSC
jgi:hypothetical protein